MRPAARALLGAALLIVAVVVFVVLQDGGDDGPAGGGGPPAAERPDEAGDATAPPTETRGGGARSSGPPVPTIVVEDGAPLGGVAELDFEAGEQVRFQVRSDRADALHVHGYDVERELPTGRTVRIAFPATIEGIFEAELHESGEQIAELRVNP